MLAMLAILRFSIIATFNSSNNWGLHLVVWVLHIHINFLLSQPCHHLFPLAEVLLAGQVDKRRRMEPRFGPTILEVSERTVGVVCYIDGMQHVVA